jgi:glycosyltransferase involved in cell wall biosynthesis
MNVTSSLGSRRPPADVVLDCRWLGIGGAGRVTEYVVRGLAEEPPDGRWLLWGPPVVEALAWPGADVALTTTDPRELSGQRSWFDIPPGRLVVFLHQQRPLRRLPAVTTVYDTIPLRHGSSPLARRAKRAYLRRAVRVSRHVLTISQHSRDCIRRDLGVPDDRISVLDLPIDAEMAARVCTLRREAASTPTALYVGRFAAHKNLARLISAFDATAFRSEGGRLLLVGGTPAEVERVRSTLTPGQRAFVDVRGRCDQDELEGLLAAARFVVQPSLEEGFGLPVLEALAGGVPVCVSDGGALPEVTRGLATPFSATSVREMAEAIDSCAHTHHDIDALAAAVRQRSPDREAFARQFRQIVEGQLADRPSGR